MTPVYATASYPCDTAGHDNSVWASGIGHNSFDESFRSPFGAVASNQGTVTLRLRACRHDIDAARVRLWHSSKRQESWASLQWKSEAWDPTLGPVEFWEVQIPINREPHLLFYFFEMRDGDSLAYYTQDPTPPRGGGWGRFSRTWDDQHSYQVSVYDPEFKTPNWLKGAVIYQILPDRFRNGDPTNDPVTGTGFVFEKKIRKLNWADPLCDPRSDCPRESDNQFYGGDLAGIIDKLDYLSKQGVRLLYLNPIFLSATNHRYDTQDYFRIEPKLGNLQTFDRLVAEAKTRGVRVVLDGVFNHGSADSPYFDIYNRWGQDGACQSVSSFYRTWFYFPHMYNRPIDHATPGKYFFCKGSDGSPVTYEAWWGYFEHPIFNKWLPEVRNYFYAGGPQSVAPWWVARGTGGWRLDVAGEVTSGEGFDPRNDYWQGFRQAVKATDPEAILIGEEWGNASSWLLGHEWDSATNYRFRSILLGWLADGCVGSQGCDQGTTYWDDDNNANSSGGDLRSISETQLDSRLRAIEEETPPEAWHSLMNVLGSHDTQRVLFVLKKISYDNEALARRKLLLGTLLQFLYPGAPVILYGDEAGVKAEGKFYNGRYYDDPYARAVFPWADQGLQPDTDLQQHFRTLAQIRNTHPALLRGSFRTLQANDQDRVLIFRRDLPGADSIIGVLNRAQGPRTVRLPLDLPEGTTVRDILNHQDFKIMQGTLDLGAVSPLWGRILEIKASQPK